MNVTIQERLLKAEHDAINARAEAENLRAVQDYNIMMGILDDPSEDIEDEMEGDVE